MFGLDVMRLTVVRLQLKPQPLCRRDGNARPEDVTASLALNGQRNASAVSIRAVIHCYNLESGDSLPEQSCQAFCVSADASFLHTTQPRQRRMTALPCLSERMNHW